MNIIWSCLIIFCIIYSLFNGNSFEILDSLLESFDISLKSMLSISGTLILFNAILSVSIESGIFKKIGIIFKPLVKFIFPDLKDDEVIELISCSVCANFLGLGMASTPIVFKVLDIFKRDLCDDRIRKKNVFSLVSLSVSSFSLFPLTVLALREKYESLIFLKFYFIFILVSFFVSLFTIFLIRNIRYELFD